MKQEKRRFISVRVKILWSLVFVSVSFMIAVVLITYSLSISRVERLGMQLSGQYVVSAGEDIKAELRSLYSVTDEIVAIPALRKIAQLNSEPGNDSDFARYDEDIRRGIETAAPALGRGGNHGFSTIALYMKNGYSLQLTQNAGFSFQDYSACLEYFSHQGIDMSSSEYVTPFWQLCSMSGERQQLLSYVRFIYEPVTLEKVGVAVFGLRNEVLKNVFSVYAPNGYILSEAGHVLASRNNKEVGNSDGSEQLLGKIISGNSDRGSATITDINGKRQIFFYYRLSSMHSYLIVPYEIERTEWRAEMRSYVATVAAVSGGLLLLAVIISTLLSKGLTNSIASLMHFIGKVEKGNALLRYQTKSHDEISILGEKINQMLDELESLNKSREQEMRANQLTELRLMQQQINPHLLYNTLDSVLWGMQQHNYEDASQILRALSEFFKLSLSQGRMEIPLGDEIRMVESYLDIQNKARQKQFTIICDIPDDLMHQPIPKLSLQPLVENSVTHGFAGYCDDGAISIKAHVEDNVCIIVVQDNGIGMEQEEVEKLQAVLKLPACPKEHRHFGLYNIHRRITQNYGEKYGLTIESELSEYTRITVRLPYHPGEE